MYLCVYLKYKKAGMQLLGSVGFNATLSTCWKKCGQN